MKNRIGLFLPEKLADLLNIGEIEIRAHEWTNPPTAGHVAPNYARDNFQ